jgi:hypothetical protein
MFEVLLKKLPPYLFYQLNENGSNENHLKIPLRMWISNSGELNMTYRKKEEIITIRMIESAHSIEHYGENTPKLFEIGSIFKGNDFAVVAQSLIDHLMENPSMLPDGALEKLKK